MKEKVVDIFNKLRKRQHWAFDILVVLFLLSLLMMIGSAIFSPGKFIYPLTILWGIFTVIFYTYRLFKARSPWRYPVLVLLLIIYGWAIFAGRPYNSDDLRSMYRSRLISFNGVIYLWGGESHIGIDCSGLARAALYESMIFEGFRTGNPRLLGPEMWDFWRHDISAKAMGEGTYGYTYKICKLSKLAGADTNKMNIGDLAVTESGLHVLIYIGDNEWIQAAPGKMKVFISTATPKSTDIFFQSPVKIMRWRWL